MKQIKNGWLKKALCPQHLFRLLIIEYLNIVHMIWNFLKLKILLEIMILINDKIYDFKTLRNSFSYYYYFFNYWHAYYCAINNELY